jgi:hypothetical protein
VPRLWRSHDSEIPTQPFRAGLTFSGRPSGPRWVWFQRHLFYPQLADGVSTCRARTLLSLPSLPQQKSQIPTGAGSKSIGKTSYSAHVRQGEQGHPSRTMAAVRI